jgi:hypothetical protein
MKQCRLCPWKVSTDPTQIPNGYSETAHRALRSTIASQGTSFPPLRMMACHETPVGAERACAGWVNNQLGPGNNIPLRLAALRGLIEPFEVEGPQHERFEDTLP